jgi:hypothetical protein
MAMLSESDVPSYSAAAQNFARSSPAAASTGLEGPWPGIYGPTPATGPGPTVGGKRTVFSGFGQPALSCVHADEIEMMVSCIDGSPDSPAYFNVWMTASDNLGNPPQQESQLAFEVMPNTPGVVTFFIKVTGPVMTISLTGQPLGTMPILSAGDYDSQGIASEDFNAMAPLCSPVTFTYTAVIQYPPVYLNGVDVDLTLDYIPITILYCPPDQDMLNSLEQNTNYGTVVTLGNGATSTSFYQSTTSLGGGVQLSAGTLPGTPVPINASVSGGTSTQAQNSFSSSQNTAISNVFNFSYSWDTLLTADNQATVGRNFWGPLGDLFLLLKNPSWNVKQATDGTYVLNPTPSYEAEVVIVPGHKLLNPTGDPIASAISEATRQKLLELDPFYTNLAPFFPPGDVPPAANLDPSDAVDPYVDPSTGSDFTDLDPSSTVVGDNRACLIASYGVDNGVVLDLTTQHSILFTDNNANQSTFNADVVSMTSVTGAISLPFLNVNGSDGSVNSQSMQISYQTSHETIEGAIQTAHCRLVRNQVEGDLDVIQVWYDKLFSTFLFRRVAQARFELPGTVYTSGKPTTGLLERLSDLGPTAEVTGMPSETPQPGAASGITRGTTVGKTVQHPLANIKVTLTRGQNTYSTMTDPSGSFHFYNLPEPGKYVLSVGGTTKTVMVSAGGARPVQVTGVTRAIDVRSCALWELETLGLSRGDAVGLKQQVSKTKRLSSAAIQKMVGDLGVRLSGDTVLDSSGKKLASLSLPAASSQGRKTRAGSRRAKPAAGA